MNLDQLVLLRRHLPLGKLKLISFELEFTKASAEELLTYWFGWFDVADFTKMPWAKACDTAIFFFFLNDWLMSLNLCLVTVINWKRNSSGSFPKIIAKPFSDWTIVQHYTMHISVDYRPYEREICQRVITLNAQWKRMTDCCWLCSVDIVLGIDAKKCSWVG